MNRRFGQRTCERRHWVSFAYVGENDGAFKTNGEERNDLDAREVNVACNVTILLCRMLRKGAAGWRARKIDPS
jgi:hypothetical protein